MVSGGECFFCAVLRFWVWYVPPIGPMAYGCNGTDGFSDEFWTAGSVLSRQSIAWLFEITSGVSEPPTAGLKKARLMGIRWISSVQTFLTFAGSIFSGRYFDSHGARALVVGGTSISFAAVIAISCPFLFLQLRRFSCANHDQFVRLTGNSCSPTLHLVYPGRCCTPQERLLRVIGSCDGGVQLWGLWFVEVAWAGSSTPLR